MYINPTYFSDKNKKRIDTVLSIPTESTSRINRFQYGNCNLQLIHPYEST